MNNSSNNESEIQKSSRKISNARCFRSEKNVIIENAQIQFASIFLT
jgi:uncharacterized protein (DUF3084 family)